MGDTTRRMMKLFEGFADAYGTHGKFEKNSTKGGKLEIKKSARTIREKVTEELWDKHLTGETALGIIPIRGDNTCVWGCIDVDRYDINHSETVKIIKRKKLPLVVCRTKSGGAHAFLFLSSPAPAEDLRASLRNMAASLGWGDCEIFPKQNQVLVERGDLGSWLNMPYLGGDETDRYAVKEGVAAYSLDEFIEYAERSRVELDKLGAQNTDVDLGDGPPCLQHLTQTGFPEGTRNNGLFALGVYCQKKYGENWRPELEELNRKYMNPPLSSDEVMGLVKNLEKKEYNYSCRDQPLCSYCESAVCKGRKFGVGGDGVYPDISGLSKLETNPPIWFMDIDDKRVELTSKQLQNYREFQLICMEQITVMFMPLRNDTWVSLVSSAMQNAVIIEAAPEMSIEGHLFELIESFCMDRHRAERWEDVYQGRPFLDPDTGNHCFRLKDLMAFLKREGFNELTRNKIGQRIIEVGGKYQKTLPGNRHLRLFFVPDEMFEETPTTSLPEMKGEPI